MWDGPQLKVTEFIYAASHLDNKKEDKQHKVKHFNHAEYVDSNTPCTYDFKSILRVL